MTCSEIYNIRNTFFAMQNQTLIKSVILFRNKDKESGQNRC